MKTRILTLFLIFAGTIAFAQQPEWHFPEPTSGFDSNASWFVNVSIDGELQTDVDVLEIAAFIGDEVRSREFYQTFPLDGHDYACMTIMALVNETRTINFRLYDHRTNQEFEGICLEDTPYVANALVGGPVHPFTLHFVTPTTCTFTNVSGNNWSTAANWSPRIPASCDDAVINGACVATEADLIFKSLTIKDGAQFYAPEVEDVIATVEKNITGYSSSKDNYYFIANPTDTEFLETGNLLEGNYDLYFFDQAGVDDPDADEPLAKEWQNYKDDLYSDPEDFMADWNGYLYANNANIVLSFTGVLTLSSSEDYKKLVYDNSTTFAGFNLVGNPYPCNATVERGSKTSGFYMLNRAGAEVVTVESPIIAPCTALFVVATAKNNNNASATFTPNIEGEGNVRNATSLINIEVCKNDNLLDRAYVRFNEQDNLQKFTLNPEATHIYFREGDKDFAIVKGNERMSQLPLYFETREYGIYTINVKLENMNCEYLHLIDNMTGADIDLNTTPSYTFRANQGDYASRFKLVFEGTGVEENNAVENFAIVEGNRVIIPMIEHESTLEIIDMTGRTISSQKVNGSFDQTLNVNTGIYLLRMNGNVQKIVVR